MYGSGHQLLAVKLLQATMGGFTGRDIFHGLEHATSAYAGRLLDEIQPDCMFE